MIYEKLQEIQDSITVSNKSFRLWKVDNYEDIWSELIEIGVNFISVDDLERFYRYYNQYQDTKMKK